jgi:hypothetical protein
MIMLSAKSIMLSVMMRLQLFWVSLFRMTCWGSCCWVSLCPVSCYWVSLCWVSLYWLSLCWVSCITDCRNLAIYAECHATECHYTQCHVTECHYVECHYTDCSYAECHYTDCCYAECHYAECCSVSFNAQLKLMTSTQRGPNKISGLSFTKFLKINLRLKTWKKYLKYFKKLTQNLSINLKTGQCCLKNNHMNILKTTTLVL